MLGHAITCLRDATGAIEDIYMLLPMAMQEARALERVYTYELYHQLRSRWVDPYYSWGGEISKRGHIHFQHPTLRKIPDLLLHHPGDHAGNLLVIEIKMATTFTRPGLCKDLQTLTAFRQDREHFLAYQGALFLLVGGSMADVNRALQLSLDIEGVDTNLIRFYWHPGPGERARLIPWHGR